MDALLIDIAISAIFTIVFYLTIPIILILIGHPLKKRALAFIACANAVIVHFIFVVITDGNSSNYAFIIWGNVSYWLMKKRILKKSDDISKPIISPSEEPSIEKNTDSPQISVSAENYCVDSQVNHQAKTQYCSKCGSLIDGKTKKCTGCGKQYFRWKSLTRFLLFTIPIAVLSFSLYYYYSEYTYYESQYRQANRNIEELKQTLEQTELILKQRENELNDICDNVDELSEKISPMIDDIEFYHEHVVFRSDDGTGLYHKYGCPRLDMSEFWAYNTEYAEVLGFEPCNFCADQDYPIETPTRESFIKKYGNHYIDN